MDPTFIIRARHLIPQPGEEIDNGAVGVHGCRIVAVGTAPHVRRRLSGPMHDLGDAVLLPGLINAHTHLELTDLAGGMKPADTFCHWLRQLGQDVVRWKLEDRLLLRRRGRFWHSTIHAIAKCLAAGTTTVGDISNSGASFHVLCHGPLRSVVYREVLELRTRSHRRAIRRLRRRLLGRPRTAWMTPGLSPHAPYSVSMALYRHCALLAGELNAPLTTHLHETPEEIEAFLDGTGELRRVMGYFMRRPDAGRTPGRPLAVLDGMGAITHRTLLAHCNYLDASDLAMLDDRKPSVVFCPRSHAFFGHERHPVRRLLDLGIHVALGTDSLASTESLSVLDEMRFLMESRDDLSPQEILAMATLHGARALELDGRVGRLAPGFEADVTVLGTPVRCPRAHEAVLHPGAAPMLTIVRGRVHDVAGVLGPAPSRVVRDSS